MGLIELRREGSSKGKFFNNDIINQEETQEGVSSYDGEIQEESPINEGVSNLDNYVSNENNYLNNIENSNQNRIKEEIRDPGLNSNNEIRVSGNVLEISFFTILHAYLLFAFLIIMVVLALQAAIYFVPSKYLPFINSEGAVELFKSQSSYTTEEYNTEIKKTMLYLAVMTTGIGLIALVSMHHAVRKRFVKYYLNKWGMIIHSVFVVFIHIFLMVLICLYLFNEVETVYKSLLVMKSMGRFLGDINIEVILHFKMFIVIILSIIMTISAYLCIEVIYNKNKYILEEKM